MAMVATAPCQAEAYGPGGEGGGGGEEGGVGGGDVAVTKRVTVTTEARRQRWRWWRWWWRREGGGEGRGGEGGVCGEGRGAHLRARWLEPSGNEKMKSLLTHEIKARAMARALPRGTTSSAMQVQIRTNVRFRAQEMRSSSVRAQRKRQTVRAVGTVCG